MTRRKGRVARGKPFARTVRGRDRASRPWLALAGLALAFAGIALGQTWRPTAPPVKLPAFERYELGKGTGGRAAADLMPQFTSDGLFVAFKRIYVSERREGLWVLACPTQTSSSAKGFCYPLVGEAQTLSDFAWDPIVPRIHAPRWPKRAYRFFYTQQPEGSVAYGQVEFPVADDKVPDDLNDFEAMTRKITALESLQSLPYVGPEVSPDGNYATFTQNGILYVCKRVGPLQWGPPTKVNVPLSRAGFSEPQKIWWPRWDARNSPPRRLAFQTAELVRREAIGDEDIYLLDPFNPETPAIGVVPKAILADPKASEVAPSWSPTGRFLAYYNAYLEGGSARNDLYVLPMVAGRPKLIEKNVYRSFNGRGPNWVRSRVPMPSEWIVYASGNNREVRIADVVSGKTQTLTGIIGDPDPDSRVVTDVDGFASKSGDRLVLQVAYSARYAQREGNSPIGIYVDEWELHEASWAFERSVFRPNP